MAKYVRVALGISPVWKLSEEDEGCFYTMAPILNIHDGVALGEIAITEETSEISTAEDAEEAEEIDEVGVQVTTPDQRVSSPPPRGKYTC
ncbi:hypothetical protein QR680_011889 [Steinernema hermaphroditum]|uniref:Uncharacterized protein n=1 Tax=Steinernema hermaphroditum TaxID=289476 RepID=A0AA39I033_9BILA|nr:hypothetical protein QR680_011889 [Steinernema hermaphroditum]